MNGDPNSSKLKLQNFSVTPILREIKVSISRVSKYATLTHFEGQNYEFYEFLHFLKAKIYPFNKIQRL